MIVGHTISVGSAFAGGIILPPAFSVPANARALSRMNTTPPVDLSDEARVFTAEGSAAHDVTQTLFGRAMTKFDGTDDLVRAAQDGDAFEPGAQEFSGFAFIHTADPIAGGQIMGYIELQAGQWRTYWNFSMDATGHLSFTIWTGLTGSGQTTMVDPVALEADTTYLVGFSKSTWSGAGHKNRKLFGGKITDPECVLRHEVEQNVNTSTTTTGDGTPRFTLGGHFQNGVIEGEFTGHIGEFVFLNGEDYVTESFPMPTIGWSGP